MLPPASAVPRTREIAAFRNEEAAARAQRAAIEGRVPIVSGGGPTTHAESEPRSGAICFALVFGAVLALALLQLEEGRLRSRS